MLNDKIEEIRIQAAREFAAASNTRELYDLKVKFLGKQGSFSNVMKEMGKLSVEEKPLFGKLVNEVKQALEAKYEELEDLLKAAELNAKLEVESLDLTLPPLRENRGSQHPIAIVIEEIFSRALTPWLLGANRAFDRARSI